MKETQIADFIEQVLIHRRRRLFTEQLISEIGKQYSTLVSAEQINSIVTSEKNRFSFYSNGSIMLNYEKIFWEIIDSIRNQLTHSRYYQNALEPIVLFVLRLRSRPALLTKLKLDSKKYLNLSVAEFAREIYFDFNGKNTTITNQFSYFIKQSTLISWQDFENIESKVSEIPDHLFSIYFTDLFRSTNRSVVEFIEPNSTSAELIAALGSTLPSYSVFDPFAGSGSFIAELYKIQPNIDRFYYLNDLVIETSLLGEINLFLNGVENFQYTTGDAFKLEEKHNADLILSNPPFYNDKKYHNVIECVLEQLSIKGQALIIIPDNYLSGHRYKRERDLLVRSGRIRSVISLPPGLFKPLASIKTSILHITKAELKGEPILFIKTNNLTNDELSDSIADLSASFVRRIEEEGRSRLISIEDIILNDINLSAPIYFLPSFQNYGNSELGQLVKPLRQIGSYQSIKRDVINDQRIGFPIVRASSLLDTLESIYLNIQSIKSFTSQLQGIRLPKNTLLLSLTGPNLRPTLVDVVDPLIIDGRSVIPLQILSDLVIPEYLVYQLQEENVQAQVRAYYQGVHFQYIRREDLYKVRIHIPPYEEQQQYIEHKRQSLGLSQIQKREEIAYERFSTLKHSMAQPLRTLSSDFTTLRDYLSEKSEEQIPINLTDYTAPIFEGEDESDLEKLRLTNVTDRINKSIKYLQNSLNKVDALIKTSVPLETKPVQIKQLLEKILEMNRDNTYSFRVIGPEVTLRADQFLLEAAFSYLVENAVKHGFEYKNSNDTNSIIAEITKRKFSNIEILLMNNGRRMADGMDNEVIFEKGRTSNKRSGSGFGGFVINEIIKKHQGSIELFSRTSDAYPVQFKIILPI
ncbi:N-6 DNA methylase [Spirosoma validum]|uniref:site-specific DNA-methyltransferase (adenine-specific) n=1 Tax=Spirosoma validum TaxID=2771355 RepID=A0A927B7G8_9BACT|nr:N-6 DNA methylase [Spirosoma validum]MBD2757115.1 N-6 DNA methylase [Spirosoma validum]